MFKELLLNESSLSRLIQHNEKHDCGTISAFRQYLPCGYDENGKPCDDKPQRKLDTQENKKRSAALGADLKKLGYSITKIIGKYVEGNTQSKEISYFVVDINDTGNLKRDLIKLGEKYSQDSILFIPKGALINKETSYLISTNDCCNNFIGTRGKIKKLKGGVWGKDGIFTTYVGGRPFYLNLTEQSNEIFGSYSNIMMAEFWSRNVDKLHEID